MNSYVSYYQSCGQNYWVEDCEPSKPVRILLKMLNPRDRRNYKCGCWPGRVFRLQSAPCACCFFFSSFQNMKSFIFFFAADWGYEDMLSLLSPCKGNLRRSDRAVAHTHTHFVILILRWPSPATCISSLLPWIQTTDLASFNAYKPSFSFLWEDDCVIFFFQKLRRWFKWFGWCG